MGSWMTLIFSIEGAVDTELIQNIDAVNVVCVVLRCFVSQLVSSSAGDFFLLDENGHVSIGKQVDH
jgi:hypothetical protein